MFTARRLVERVAHISVLFTLLATAARSGFGQTTSSVTTYGGSQSASTPNSGIGQTTSVVGTSGGAQSGSTSIGQPQSPFQGSVPTGQATGTSLALSLKDAFDRALKYNLGAIESDQSVRAARATRLRNLSALLPNLYAQVSATEEQVNLQALGLRLQNIHIPGFSIPTIVGPFSIADARAYLAQQIFNWSDIKNWKSASQSEFASKHSNQNDRELVILVTATAYLQVIADVATVESNRAQVRTNQVIYEQDVDRNKSGVIASIDVLRAKVQLQSQQQQLISAENQLAIDKLALARIIGLPNGQEFQLTDLVPYAPLTDITLEQALKQAYVKRADYLAAKAQVRAAELALQAAQAQNYPSLAVDANYGDIGSPNFGTSHGTFAVAGTITIPLFLGTQVRADKLQADSTLQDRRSQLADLGGKIDTQVRTAFFNLKSSSDLVAVAQSNIDLANQTLEQAQHRFQAGVANNLEVVQAQQSIALANQSYISSLYSYNSAKVSLAQAIGVAQESGLQFLGVK
jgi:outer membrane protein TolC